jgi:hypothetical protein
MGYTHHWYLPVGSEVPRDTWARIRDDARKLIGAAPCKLVFRAYRFDRPPLVDEEWILFNGADRGEDFMLQRSPKPWHLRPEEREVISSCKTERLPYDLVVCAILAIAREHAPALIRVTSDGNATDWQPALCFASQVLSRNVPQPFD